MEQNKNELFSWLFPHELLCRWRSRCVFLCVVAALIVFWVISEE